jgi:copper homeostasis protein
MKNHKLEIACFNYESAFIAQQGGADRIELCDSFSEGGTTPDFKTIELTRQNISIDLFIMIRPRRGDFIYSDKEFEQMKADILKFKKTGVNGFVFGILTADNKINIKQNKELVELANPLPCSFHRAFDKVEDSFQALEDVVSCGFQTLLCSGHPSSAIEGIAKLSELIKQASGRMVIMPGGGVRSSNISILKEKVTSSFYHSSAITTKSNIADLNEVKLLKEKLK